MSEIWLFLAPVWVFIGALLFVLGFARLIKRPVLGLSLAFFTSGILLSPNLPLVREKLTATEFVFLFLWFALLLKRGSSTQSGKLLSSQKLAVGLGACFIFWAFLSFALNNIEFTFNFVPSLVETGNLVYGYLMFVTVVMLARERESWLLCLKGWAAGTAVVGFFGVWGMVGGAPEWVYEDFTGRISSTLRNENQVPSFVLPVLLALVFMAAQKGISRHRQLVLWAIVAGAIVTSVGSGSRTAFLMLLVVYVGGVYVAVMTAGQRPYRIGSMFVLSVAMVVGLAVYVFLALVSYDGDYALGKTPAWQRPVVMLYDWAMGKRALDTTRPEQFVGVIENIGDHFFLGTGPKIYGVMLGMAEIHNTYAGVLIQTGAVGFVLFMAWLLYILLKTLLASRKVSDVWLRTLILCLFVGMGTLLLYNMTMFGLRQRTIWLLAGLLVASWSFSVRRGISEDSTVR